MEQETVIRTGVTLPLKLAVRCLRPVADGVARMVSLLWWPIFLSSSVLGVGTTALHFIAHGYVELERDARVGISDAWASTVKWAAETTGYEIAVPQAEGRTLSPEEEVERAALMHGISPALARAQFKKEGSRGNPRATSPKGAVGLMQLTPPTAKKVCGLDVDELYDARKNAECGFKIMRTLLRKYGDVRKALADYNGGPGGLAALERCGENAACLGGYVETRDYVRDIILWSATDIAA